MFLSLTKAFGRHRCSLKFVFLLGRHLGLKLLTSDMAQKRRWSLANRCYLCFKERETIEPVYTLCENKSHGNFFFPLIGLLGNAFLGERDFNQLARIFCGEKRLESNTSTFTLDNLE